MLNNVTMEPRITISIGFYGKAERNWFATCQPTLELTIALCK